MKVKSVPVTVKAGPDDGLEEGEFIVYPSTFIRQADSYGDVIAKGAFLDDIASRKDAGTVLPGLYGHRMDDPDFFIASATEESEDDHGWRVRGFFDLDNPKAAQTYRLAKSKRLNQLSFAYDVIDEGVVELENGVRANELRKVKVYEFSFVPLGANQDTSIVAVKSAVDALTTWPGFKAGRSLSAKNEAALKGARDAIDSVLASLGDEDGKAAPAADHAQEQASGTPEAKSDANDEEPEGAKSSASDEEPKGSPSVSRLAAQAHLYALTGQKGA